MNTMTYKGYIGSVNYSDKDQVFFGKIEGINDLVFRYALFDNDKDGVVACDGS